MVAKLNNNFEVFLIHSYIQNNEQIKLIFRRAFFEISASLAIVLVTAPFIATPLPLYIAYSLGTPLINLALRTASVWLGRYRFLSFMIRYFITPIIFSFNYLNVRILLHEFGHAGVIALLSPESVMKISIEAFSKGSVQIIRGSASNLLVAAGGPIVDLIMSVGLMVAAVKCLKKKRPILSSYLGAFSIVTAISNIDCSINNAPANDFKLLSSGLGVPPQVFTVAIIVVLLISLKSVDNGRSGLSGLSGRSGRGLECQKQA